VASKDKEYLKSRVTLRNIQKEQHSFYDNTLYQISMIEQKQALARTDLKLYKSLVEQMSELRNAGVKTDKDVEILKNSQKARALDIDIYEIDKQLLIFELHAKTSKASWNK
jgi:uncharacterized membrane protein YgaE (UPF0421/DUF939 family)